MLTFLPVLGLACARVGGLNLPDSPVDSVEGGEADVDYGIYNFSWVVDGRLAGMGRPGTTRDLQEDIQELAELGIAVLVSLTEEPTPQDDLAAQGIALLHLPVEDFTAPTQEQLDTFVAAAVASLARDEAVGVHCAGGLGRTGTFLAVWFVGQGMAAQEAIDHVRALRPGSIETDEQEAAVHAWYKRRAAGG